MDLLPKRKEAWSVIDNPIVSHRLRAISAIGPNVLVGGDCMNAIGIRHGNCTLPLVWYDAHGDFHTLLTTSTGHIGGMPLAMLCGYGDQSLLQVCKTTPVSPSRVWHVGASQFDPGERKLLATAGLMVVGNLLALDINEPIHLHIDLDVVDKEDAPAVFHPTNNGMTAQTLLNQITVLEPYTKLLSIKAYDPRLDTDGKCERLVLEILRRMKVWNTPSNR